MAQKLNAFDFYYSPMDRAVEILNRYWPQFDPVAIVDLENHGGFSGSRLWKFQSQQSHWLLRRWPKGQNEARLDWIHHSIRNIAQILDGAATAVKLAEPTPSIEGSSFIEFHGFLFQVEPWLEGEARPTASDRELELAVTALAQFHQASRKVNCKTEKAPAVQRRLQRLEALKEIVEPQIVRAATRHPSKLKEELTALAVEVCRSFHRLMPTSVVELNTIKDESLELIPCLRDVWYAHVLFSNHRENEEPNHRLGFVDYGAMNIDYVGTDVARLVGSFVMDDQTRWELALQTYGRVLTGDAMDIGEFQKIRMIDRANTLISPMNWVAWIFFENRQFPNHEQVIQRIKDYAKRMQFWEDSRSEFR